MTRPRKLKIELPPDVAEWLGNAAAARAVLHMTEDRMIIKALVYYMLLPEDTIDEDGSGLRACCYTAPGGGHRGTCRYSSMRSATSREALELRQMWQNRNR